MLHHPSSYIPTEVADGLDERFCEVMDAAPVMIWVSGVDKGCVWFNRPWLTFTGRSMAQELGNGWTEGVHPDDYGRCLAIYVRHFDARDDFRMQYRLRHHDGAYRWIDDIGIPRYRNGTFLGYTGSCVDITPLKEAETALRESETRLRLATSSANLGVFEQDVTEDRTVWVNDRMYEIFGRSVQDGPLSSEQFMREYLRPEDAQALKSATLNAITTDGYLHTTFRIRLKSGEERWVQIDGTYQLTETGEPLRIVGVAADVTERMSLERRAAELSKRLINVQEEERQRITQELHDSTMQHLVAVSLNLVTLRPKTGLAQCDMQRWDETEASLKEAVREIRTFSHLLHPLALQAEKLTANIQRYVTGFSDRTAIEVRMYLSPKLDQLPYEMRRTFLRIAQEALANVHRHAEASQICLQGRVIADRVHLIVRDDGRGLMCKQDTPPGRGIRGMQDRTYQWGGELRIRTGPTGTRVHAMWPVRQ